MTAHEDAAGSWTAQGAEGEFCTLHLELQERKEKDQGAAARDSPGMGGEGDKGKTKVLEKPGSEEGENPGKDETRKHREV